MAGKERPIIFSGPMVRAEQDGRKSQTRRPIREQPPASMVKCARGVTGSWVGWDENGDEVWNAHCPYGVPGDRLWIKETHYLYGEWRNNGVTKTGRDKWKFHSIGTECGYMDDPPRSVKPFTYKLRGWYKRPSIFMCREDSRILLENTDMRVEKVQKISDTDCVAEGVSLRRRVGLPPDYIMGIFNEEFLKGAFSKYWNSIYTKPGQSWEDNPWVWALTFKQLEEKA